MRRLLVVMVFLLSCNGAFAGPPEGELFGYKLGSKYPATDSTPAKWHTFLQTLTVVADNPEKSDEFQRVELMITPITYTIGKIIGIAEVVSEKEAKDIAARYADLLRTLHVDKCPAEKASRFETYIFLKLLCAERYELSVAQFHPHKNEKKYQVHVGLKFPNESAADKEIIAQAKREWAQLRAEGKLHRLEQASKEQKLRGLE